MLPSVQDEEDLSFHGRRVRGEVFFARRWLLVEGVTEYMLVHALGRAIGWPLDVHGVAVIDFQQSGNAGIYPALAQAFGIPWYMVVDGDQEAVKFRKQIVDRGFDAGELTGHFFTLTPPNDLEDQLIADGHEARLRQILTDLGDPTAAGCPLADLRARLKNRKTAYMGVLARQISNNEPLARQMPAQFVTLITNLRDGIA
jgi:putative ATP-dependent endonuclease of OLD family